jgi:hypothetical protein
MVIHSLEQLFPVGCRVLICNGHSHEGKVGTVVKYEIALLPNKKGAIVELDDGLSCFVFYATNMRRLDE